MASAHIAQLGCHLVPAGQAPAPPGGLRVAVLLDRLNASSPHDGGCGFVIKASGQRTVTLRGLAGPRCCLKTELHHVAVLHGRVPVCKRRPDRQRGTFGEHQREIRPEALRTAEIPHVGQGTCAVHRHRSETRTHKTRPKGRLTHHRQTPRRKDRTGLSPRSCRLSSLCCAEETLHLLQLLADGCKHGQGPLSRRNRRRLLCI